MNNFSNYLSQVSVLKANQIVRTLSKAHINYISDKKEKNSRRKTATITTPRFLCWIRCRLC